MLIIPSNIQWHKYTILHRKCKETKMKKQPKNIMLGCIRSLY